MEYIEIGDVVKNGILYRRDGRLVYIKQPEYKELSYVKKLWADINTMRDVGGTFQFPEDKWETFYKKMVTPTDGKNFYCLIYSKEDVPVGEVSFHGYDSATKIARLNVKVHDLYRNHGYGEEAVRLLLEYYFYNFGGNIMMDKVDNEKGQGLLSKLGFDITRRDLNEITFKMTRDKFLNLEKRDKKTVLLFTHQKMDLMSFSIALSLFEKMNNYLGEEQFKIKLFGIKEGKFKLNNFIEINNEYGLQNVKEGNILFIPSADIELGAKEQEGFKILCDNCETIAAVECGVLLLAKLGLLKDISTSIDQKYYHNLKSIDSKILLKKDNIIDNGRIITCSNVFSTERLIIDLFKKFIGGSKCSEFVAKIKGE